MSLTREEVTHIAKLAHLQLDEAEIERFLPQLESILEYADRLRQVDTSTISPTTTVLPLRSILRDDISRPSLTQADAMANTSRQDRMMFDIPPVFE